MQFKGPVNLKDPDVTLQFIEYYGLDPNTAPEKPTRTFFGRVVSIQVFDLPLIYFFFSYIVFLIKQVFVGGRKWTRVNT